MDKEYLIVFKSGVMVLTHWKMQNCIQKGRYRGTVYVDERSALGVKQNKMYVHIDDIDEDEEEIDEIDFNWF